MKLDFKTLCACLALVYGNVLADVNASRSLSQSSIGKFVENVKETQRESDARYRKTRELSPKWFAAAESGDLEEMKKLWDEAFKYNIYIKDDSERTALEIAVTNGHADMVKWLADRTDEQEKADRASNFNLKSSNKDRKAMMIVAAENGFENIVKIMLSRNLDPNIYRDLSAKGMGKTPMIAAAEHGHAGVVELLLSRKGDPNLTDTVDRTALMYAAREGHSDIVELLLNNEADPNKKDTWGDTALILAVCSDELSVVKSLLEHGADPNIKNKDKETALICAAKIGSYNIVKILLENGAKTDTKDKDKKTALDYAKKDTKIFDLLTDYAAKPENQKKNLFKKAWNKVTKKNADQNSKNGRLSADSDATLYEDDTEQERDIDDLISSTDTLVDD